MKHIVMSSIWAPLVVAAFAGTPSCKSDACGTEFADPEACGPNVVIPPGSIEVAEGIYLPNATESEDPMPTPSNDPNAPVVLSGETSNPSAGTVKVTLATSTSIDAIHVQIEGKHYIIDPTLETGGSGNVADIDACEILAEQQGYSCTQACLKACGCVSCGQSAMEDAIEQACSVNCSVYSAQGLLSEQPWNGSETNFAYYVYEGYDQGGASVPGLLEQFPNCNTSQCEAPSSGSKSYSFNIIGVDYPSVPIIGPGMTSSQPANVPSLTSQDFTPPGGLNTESCHHGECGPF